MARSRRIIRSALLAALLMGAAPACYAQAQPDAGQTLQELRQRPALPTPSSDLRIAVPASETVQPGGPQVSLRGVSIYGNKVFSDETLLNAVGPVDGRSYDLAGLRGLAGRITDFYREQGYPFARAFVPEQSLEGRILRIDVIEGRYGAVKATGTDPRIGAAQDFLSVLTPGAPIESSLLERTGLILDDQPGYKVTPIVRPGQHVGTGDLDVRVDREKAFGVSVGVDNHGNRYTGRNRARADFVANSPFMFGDQVRVSGLYTQEGLWFGSAGYSLPVGVSGLRANVGYTHTYYELGKQFAVLDAHGTARVASAGLSYPIIRSQNRNLSISGTYQHKWLTDKQGLVGTSADKTSDSLPVALAFDMRDGLAGGGVTYGTLSWTHGILNLDSGLAAIDRITARSEGAFDKINLDVARLQSLPLGLALFGRLSAQWAGDNLDSSERFGLGGANGVRAYPSGEGFGDAGVLGQVELRYNTGALAPYAFYDAGRVTINENPWAPGVNHRSVGGAGLGLRADWHGVNADANLAWRTFGGDPRSDSRDEVPRVNVSLGYSF